LPPGQVVAEQAAIVRRLAGSGVGLEVVVGQGQRGQEQRSGRRPRSLAGERHPVFRAAVAARAAIALSEAVGMPGMTVSRHLTPIDRNWSAGQASGQGNGQGPGRYCGLPRGAVLVVDEAAGGRLMLVGDHKQLPELAAAGPSAGLVGRLDRP
jgi:hypothetical protein